MQGRGQVQFAELGLTSEGRIVGLRLRVLGECGAYAGFGGALAVGPTYLMAQGVYDVPELRFDALGVMTNTAPVGAFRGAGRPEAAACIERMIDLAADELGIAPEEIRRRNFIQPDAFPFTTKTGVTYDIGDYDMALTEALRVADVESARAEQRRRIDAGERRLLGIGMATYVEITGFGGSEYGQVEVHEDGTATVRSGTSSHGQGHATSFSMIAVRPAGHPAGGHHLRAVRHRHRSPGAAARAARARSRSAATPWARPPTSCARRPSSWPRGCSRRPRTTWCSRTARSASRASRTPGSPGRSSRRTPTSTRAAWASRRLQAARARRSPSARTSRSSRSTPTPAGCARCGTSRSTTAVASSTR